MKRFTFNPHNHIHGRGNGPHPNRGLKSQSKGMGISMSGLGFTSTPTFDPNQPQNGALVEAGVLRDQFNSLYAMIQAIPAGPPGPQGPEGPPGEVTEEQLNTALWNQTPSNVNSVVNLSPDTASATYNQAQMQAVIDKLNQLIVALWRI